MPQEGGITEGGGIDFFIPRCAQAGNPCSLLPGEHAPLSTFQEYHCQIQLGGQAPYVKE